jgi:hypothetical protein
MISLNNYEQIPLNWMFDNQPDLVREMMKSPKSLLEHLDKKVQQALEYEEILKQQRLEMSSYEVSEIAAQLILAPADGPATSDDPPKAIPLPEQKAIFNRLSALLDRMEAEQNEEMN